jgi:hypothetical protein
LIPPAEDGTNVKVGRCNNNLDEDEFSRAARTLYLDQTTEDTLVKMKKTGSAGARALGKSLAQNVLSGSEVHRSAEHRTKQLANTGLHGFRVLMPAPLYRQC